MRVPYAIFYLSFLLGSASQARFLQNLSLLLADPFLVENCEERSFLERLEEACDVLSAERDGTYYKGSGDVQSSLSAQARLCATVIFQYQEDFNPSHTNMRGCFKFKGEMLQCCEVFERGYQKAKTSDLASALCHDVPNHLLYMHTYRQNRAKAADIEDAGKKKEETGEEGYRWGKFFARLSSFFP